MASVLHIMIECLRVLSTGIQLGIRNRYVNVRFVLVRYCYNVRKMQ
jgi:hypothetical protein